LSYGGAVNKASGFQEYWSWFSTTLVAEFRALEPSTDGIFKLKFLNASYAF